MNLNLEYYRAFYYVGKYQSITRAAQELSISQPAVSQAIRNLELALGTSLFVRTPKGMQLSAEGSVLYPWVAQGYEYICLGEQKLREQMDLEAGEIRIGASDMTLQFYLLDYLEQFHEQYPRIKVRVTNAPTPETLKHLREGKIDFGAVTAPISGDTHLTLHKVREIRDIFVAGEKYKSYSGREISFTELETLPLISLEGKTSSRTYVEEFVRKFQVQLRPEFELATSDMLIQFARRGLGIACVVEDFARKDLENGSLFALKLTEEIPPRAMYLVTNEQIPMSSAARRLLELTGCPGLEKEM